MYNFVVDHRAPLWLLTFIDNPPLVIVTRTALLKFFLFFLAAIHRRSDLFGGGFFHNSSAFKCNHNSGCQFLFVSYCRGAVLLERRDGYSIISMSSVSSSFSFFLG